MEWKPESNTSKNNGRKFYWVISNEQIAEIKRVIEYPHLKFTEKQKIDIIAMIHRAATIIKIEKKVSIIHEDPSDNTLLDIALASEADYLISGDNHLLKIEKISKTRIMKPSAFVKEIIPI